MLHGPVNKNSPGCSVPSCSLPYMQTPNLRQVSLNMVQPSRSLSNTLLGGMSSTWQLFVGIETLKQRNCNAQSLFVAGLLDNRIDSPALRSKFNMQVSPRSLRARSTWRIAALALAPLIRLFVCAVSLMSSVIVVKVRPSTCLLFYLRLNVTNR